MDPEERIEKISSQRTRFFVSLLFNMAAIAPMFTWPLFIPQLDEYFMTTSESTLVCSNTLFALQLGIAGLIEPIIGWLIRKFDCRLVIVLGYSLLISGTVWGATTGSLDQFIILIGVLGTVGASIIAVSSLLILWEWYTPS